MFLAVALLATPQFFVTPLFFPVVLLLVTCSITAAKYWKRIVIALGCFLLINSFWLLPYIYSIPQVGPVIQAAKINEISSNEIYLRNQVFGDFKSVSLLRGFALDYVDSSPDTGGWMMAAWRNIWNTPLATAIYGAFFTVAILGIFFLFKNRHKDRAAGRLFPYVIPFAICFMLLGNDIPGLSQMNSLIRTAIPLFGEAFRFAFTKFSLLYVFTYSLLLGYGILQLSSFCDRIHNKFHILLYTLTISALVFVSWPSFNGEFFYGKLRIWFPKEYTELTQFMSGQNPNGRTALLPQTDFWNWKYYRFGYRGSGFLWYGLPQPTLDRAFDPWSGENENYYWELSKALYSKDSRAFDDVLTKYDIRFLLVDENLMTTGNATALFLDQMKEMLLLNSDIHFIASYGKTSVYERRNDQSQAGIALVPKLPVVGPRYLWNDVDTAYSDLGNYISAQETKGMADIVYPFRSLFTKRAAYEREVGLSENEESIIISPRVQEATASAAIPKTGSLLYDSDATVSLNPNDVKDCSPNIPHPVSAQRTADTGPAGIEITNHMSRSCISFGMSELWHRYGYIVAIESRHVAGEPLRFAVINGTAKHTELETFLPDTPGWQTTYFVLPPLASDGLNYDVYITNDSIGRYDSVNDVRRIRVYRIPYQELTNMKSGGFTRAPATNAQLTYVGHPNPAYYLAKLDPAGQTNQPISLILSQSFNTGWKAYEVNVECKMPNAKCSLLQRTTDNLQLLFPFFFGKELTGHVLVNNWENGWVLQSSDISYQSSDCMKTDSCRRTTIVLFFLPQLLEWIGFLLLPVPFLFALRKKESH
jgi:hypothetical protein